MISLLQEEGTALRKAVANRDGLLANHRSTTLKETLACKEEISRLQHKLEVDFDSFV